MNAEFVFEQDRLSTQSYYLGMLATIDLGIETMFSLHEQNLCTLRRHPMLNI
jgi:zinc protease